MLLDPMISSGALLVAVIATIFAVSAVSKAFDRAALAPVLRSIGLPAPIAATIGVVVAPLEATVALGLLASVEVAALVAITLSAGFVLTQILASIQGVNADCRCFGSLAPSRAGSGLGIARAVLLLGACFVVASSGPLPSSPDPVAIGLGLALGAATVLSFGLLESLQRFRRQSEELAAQALLELRPSTKEV